MLVPTRQQLLDRIKELEDELEEAYSRLEWAELHGPNCKCRECYIDWPDED